MSRTVEARAAAVLRALPLGGKTVALLASVAVHAAVALAFARGAPHPALHSRTPAVAFVEIAAPDLEMADAPVSLAHLQEAVLARPHTHPYPVPPGHDTTPHDPAAAHLPPALNEIQSEPAVAGAAIDVPSPAAPRFVMTVASAVQAPGGAPAAVDRAGAPSSGALGQPLPESAADTPATLIAGNSASYTREAETAGVEANVPLEIVVDSTGAVAVARVLVHVGYGLDEAALRGIRAYRFSPARRAGKALAVRMRWLMRFQLR